MATLTKSKPEAGIKLRPYQQKDLENIEEAFEKHRSVLYQLPTGGGKGIIITKFISDYKDEEIIVFAHKRKLLKQIQKNLAKMGITAGLLMGNVEDNIDAKILLVSIRTAVKTKRLESLVKRNWKKGIIDEARHSRTGSYDIVLDRMLALHPKYKLLGVDATPYRKDKKRLDKHFQALLVSSENIKSLQDSGFLAKEKTYATPIGEIMEQVKEVANDYQLTALSNYMRQDKFLNYVVDAYIKYGENKQAIVFAVDKAHSKDLLAKFKKKLPKAVSKQIDSDLSDAEIDIVYEEYEKKEIQILINVEMLTEGVDLPETNCIVGARPTKSITLYLQMAGRGTRPKEDGSDLIIIDCAGWTEEFGVISSPRQWSLDPDIDPNDLRKKNRIVGKTKEGKLTTNVKEMDEFSELVEMTPEEYVGKVEGGLKEAEKQNKTIEEKIQEQKTELEELLHKMSLKSLRQKVSPYTCVVRLDEYDKDVLTAYFFHKDKIQKKKARRSDEEIDAWIDGTHVVEMPILKEKKMMFSKLDVSVITNRGYYARKDEEQSIKEFREMSDVCASVNEMIINDKNEMMQILEKKKTIHELELSKIDIDELKNLKKRFEQEQYMKAIADHCKAGKPFMFEEPLDAGQYFKDFYRVTIIMGIEVPANQINIARNTIIMHVKDRWNDAITKQEKLWLKQEKIYELIKDSNWKP